MGTPPTVHVRRGAAGSFLPRAGSQGASAVRARVRRSGTGGGAEQNALQRNASLPIVCPAAPFSLTIMALRGWVPALWVICLLGNFLGALNGGVITLTIPTLAAEFGCSVETAAWVAFAPNFCSAMFGPSLGKLADLYGRARCWWGGMTLFVTSFLICANAQSIYLMIFGRILSGLGWAATGPAGFGILASTLERSQRGVASAMMTSTGTLGSSIGVAVGGILMDLGSWRLIFWIPTFPLGLMYLISFFILPLDDSNSSTPRSSPGMKRDRARPEDHDNSFDWLGSVVFSAFIGAFLFGVNRGNDLGWLSTTVLVLICSSLLLLPLLICVERRAANPILPISLLLDKVKFSALGAMTFTGMAYQGNFMVLPIFLQEARHLSPGDVGKVVFLRPGMGFFAGLLLSRVIKKPNAPLTKILRAGSWLYLGGWLFLLIAVSLPDEFVQAGVVVQLVLQSSGSFSVQIPANAIVVARVREDELSSTTAVIGMLQRTCTLVSSAVMLSMVGAFGVSRILVLRRIALGTISQPDAYNATWGLCIALAAVNCLICLVVPTDYTSYGKGYTQLDNEQVEIEQNEKEGLMTAHPDSDSDEEGGQNEKKSIYAQKSGVQK